MDIDTFIENLAGQFDDTPADQIKPETEFRKLAENGPTDEQFTRTLENFKKNVPENRISNNYWMSNIVRYARFGFDYDKEYEEAVSAITKEGIKEAAARFYKSGTFIEFTQKPGKTTE